MINIESYFTILIFQNADKKNFYFKVLNLTLEF